jgi:large subunit ribosomal protein L1
MKAAYEVCKNSEALPLSAALELARKSATEGFSASVDIVFGLGLPKGENVRGALSPEHGTGRTVRVAVFAQGDQAQNAKDADRVGADDLVEEIKKGDFNYDVVLATPDMMSKVGQVGRILGPKGLMPNPKVGTVTTDVAKAVENAKKGQIFFRSDSASAVHARLGPVTFDVEKLTSSVKSLVEKLKQLKPARAKGQYIRYCYISTTMGPGIQVDLNTLD